MNRTRKDSSCGSGSTVLLSKPRDIRSSQIFSTLSICVRQKRRPNGCPASLRQEIPYDFDGTGELGGKVSRWRRSTNTDMKEPSYCTIYVFTEIRNGGNACMMIIAIAIPSTADCKVRLQTLDLQVEPIKPSSRSVFRNLPLGPQPTDPAAEHALQLRSAIESLRQPQISTQPIRP